MKKTLIGGGLAALFATSALAQMEAAPSAPTEGNIPAAANPTMPPVEEPFAGDVNRSEGEPAGIVDPIVPPATAPSPADTPSASAPTEGTSSGAPPTTGEAAVPERAEGGESAVSTNATPEGCVPADGDSVSETSPAEGEQAGTAPGGSGSSGWTGGLGGSDIGTSQSEPLPSSPTQAPHPETASGLDPITGETAVSGPPSPPPTPAPMPVVASATATTGNEDASSPDAEASENGDPDEGAAAGDAC